MSTRSRRAALAVAALLVLTAPLGLAGCSAVEGFVEQQTGGEVELGAGTVPADFPAEVPLAEGDVLIGGSYTTPDGQKAWNATIRVDAADPAALIAAQLEDAGFAPQPGASGAPAGGTLLTYAGSGLVVAVLIGGTDGIWTAAYTVTSLPGG